MTRKIAIFFALCFLVASLPIGSALATQQTGRAQQPVAAITQADCCNEVDPSFTATGEPVPPPTRLGFDSRLAPAGYQVGCTWYDYQHNSSMGRQVAIGSDGRIHFVWMRLQNPTATREVVYNSAVGPPPYTFSHPAIDPCLAGATIQGTGAGYCQMGAFDDVGVAAFHVRDAADANIYKSWVSDDNSSGGGNFPPHYPAPDSCAQDTITAEFIWPKLDVETHAGPTVTVHMVSTEYETTVPYSWLIYYRATSFGPNMFGDAGINIDSVVCAEGAIVCADRTSEKVAIVWARCKFPDGQMPFATGDNSDIWYIESQDDGVTWNIPGDFVQVTNYPSDGSDSTYALCDISAMYTMDGALHIVWIEGEAWPDEGGAETIWYYPQPGVLVHWDDVNQVKTTVLDADNIHGCDSVDAPGNNCRNVCKPNLVECDENLYVTYTYFWGDVNEGNDDCSDGGFANGDVYASTSSSAGLTWGTPKNLTATNSNGCLPGSCESEHWPSSAMYSTGRLYTQYIYDRDPAGWAGGGGATQGQPTNCDVMFLDSACFAMDEVVALESSPDAFRYPFNTTPTTKGTTDTSFTVTNTGNATANYTVTINYIDGSGWLSVNPTSGTIDPPPGTNTEVFSMTATGPATEGLYKAEIEISYTPDAGVLTVPVFLYNFDPFYYGYDVAIRTSQNRLNVQQLSRVGNQSSTAGFTWNTDGSTYMFDGSLVIGNSGDNMSFQLFHELADTAYDYNKWKPLWALSDVTYDSTTYPAYRYAEGKGCIGDSTVAFTSKFYGPKHPDTFECYVAHFDIYAGPKWSSTVNDLRIAYAIDWDVPSDTGSNNTAGLLESDLAVYQKGEYVLPNSERYAGLAYRADDSTCLEQAGGFVWNNPDYVYPDTGYHVDSLIKYIDQTAATPFFLLLNDSAAITDYNSVIVAKQNAAIGSDDTISFSVIIAATNPNAKTVADLQSAIAKGAKFICDYVAPDAPHCVGCPDCKCGDADDNGIWNISDAVKLIGYIFGGDPPPPRPCNGDADGNGIVNISDAVYMITYIFGGGPEPGGCDPCQQWPK